MYYIYERSAYTYHVEFTLMDEKVKFRTKANARAYLYTLGFSRKEQGQFAILQFTNPPAWLKCPANYRGDF